MAAATAIQVITASATASRKNTRRRTVAGSPVTRDKGEKATAKVTAAAGEKAQVRPVPSENRGLLGVVRSSITRLTARLTSGSDRETHAGSSGFRPKHHRGLRSSVLATQMAVGQYRTLPHIVWSGWMPASLPGGSAELHVRYCITQQQSDRIGVVANGWGIGSIDRAN